MYLNSLCPIDKVSHAITIQKSEEKIPQLTLEDMFSILCVSLDILTAPSGEVILDTSPEPATSGLIVPPCPFKVSQCPMATMTKF